MEVAAMNATVNADNRRLEQPHIDQHWDRLSTTQRFAFYTLAKLGYQLLFVRQSSHEKTAVARQGDKLVTIDSGGDIDFSPTLVLRENR